MKLPRCSDAFLRTRMSSSQLNWIPLTGPPTFPFIFPRWMGDGVHNAERTPTSPSNSRKPRRNLSPLSTNAGIRHNSRGASPCLIEKFVTFEQIKISLVMNTEKYLAVDVPIQIVQELRRISRFQSLPTAFDLCALFSAALILSWSAMCSFFSFWSVSCASMYSASSRSSALSLFN